MTKMASASTQPEALHRVLERLGRALEAARDRGRQRLRGPAACTRATASPSATPGRRLNDSVTDGSCPVWLTDSGPTPSDAWSTTVESGTSLPRGRLHVEQRQRGRVALELRRHLHDDLVLVVGREDLRDLPRAVGRGQRELDLVHREAERGDLVAVEVDR